MWFDNFIKNFMHAFYLNSWRDYSKSKLLIVMLLLLSLLIFLNFDDLMWFISFSFNKISFPKLFYWKNVIYFNNSFFESYLIYQME